MVFSDVTEIFRRPGNILNEASPSIKKDEYNGILSSDDNFPKLMKSQYGNSFKELEILVGLTDEK